MDGLRSLLFATIFYTGSVVYVLASVPVAALGREALASHAIRWVRFHRWCARVLLNVVSRIEGSVPSGPFIIAAKHQAMYETLELLTMLDRPAVVLKQELVDIPIWGWVATIYGAIPVDRAGSASALRTMVVAARRQVAAGRPILIFPEGTRVAPGEQPPLRAGFAGLYRMLGLPVVPVALDSGRLFPRKGFLRRPGVITFRFGEPIPPGLPRPDIEARVHAAINALDAG